MKRYIKKMGAVALALSLLIVGCSGKSSQEIAKVNGEKISYEEYLKKLAVFKLQVDMTYGEEFWEEQFPGSEKTFMEQFKEEILNKVIDDKIIMQEAKKQDIKVEESEIKNLVETSIQSMNSSEEVKKYYADNKIDEKFLNSIATEDVTRLAFEKKFYEQNPVTQEEVDKYYEEHKSEFSNDQLRASHIIIQAGKDGQEPTQEELDLAKAQIDDIYGKLIGGGNFEELAKQYSQDGSKDSGGDLGYFTRDKMVPEFSDVVFAMNVGDISKPFKTRFGYHIVKVTDKKETEINVDEIKTYLKTDLQAKKFNEHITKLRETSQIEKKDELVKNIEKDIKPYVAPTDKKEEPAPAENDENKDKNEQEKSEQESQEKK